MNGGLGLGLWGWLGWVREYVGLDCYSNWGFGLGIGNLRRTGGGLEDGWDIGGGVFRYWLELCRWYEYGDGGRGMVV